MVIQDNYEVENPPVAVKTKLASERYVVVKNHVRELKHNDQECSEGSIGEKKKKRKLSDSAEVDEQNLKVSKISRSDLDELKTVYSQCKRVIENIEKKYGHLLNLTSENAGHSFYEEFHNEEECNCDRNTKIIFDEEGKQNIKKNENDKHICLRKLPPRRSKLIPKNTGLQIEYDNDNLQLEHGLPDNLIELGNLLKNPKLESKYRRNIIWKMKNLRYEYINEIKCNKEMLVKQLKVNPEEILMFEGTNISTVAGYPM